MRRWLPLLLVALLSAGALPWAGSLRPGQGNRAWIDPAGPAATALAEIEGRFGRQDGFVVALFAADVLADDAVAWQRDAAKRFAALPGVSAVDALPSALDVEIDELGAAPVPLLGRPRAEILAHPLYRNLLVAPDGRACALLLHLAPTADDAATVALAGTVSGILADLPPPAGARTVLGGLPVQQQAINRAVAADQALTVPVTVALLALLLLLVLRHPWPALLVLLATGSALAWTWASLALAGREVDALLGLLPPLVLGIGVATGLHLAWAVGNAVRAGDPDPARTALRRTIAPLGLATLTTIAGVGGLWWGAVPAVRAFAPWAALGVLLAAVFPFLWLLAAARLVPASAWAARHRGPCGDRLGERLAASATFCAGHRRTVLAATGVLFAAAAGSCMLLRADADFVHALPAGDPVRSAHQLIDERLTGVLGLDLVIDPGHPPSDDDAQRLARLGSVVRSEPSVAACLSLADLCSLLESRGDRGSTATRLADLRLGAPRVVERFVDGSALRLHARQHDGSVAEAAAAARRIADAARSEFPGARITVASGALLLDETTTRLLPAIAKGLAASLVVNSLLLLVFLRRPTLAATGLLLAAMPLVLTYAVLPPLGWPLDIGVSMIACVALGIIMDDAIHMTYALHRASDPAAAAREIGPVLTAASLALAGAFSACALGGFSYTRRFGALLALAFIVGLVVNLCLAPALLRTTRPPEDTP